MINNYPVVFFVFKRPATTMSFLNLMIKAGINKIYIFADGPRNETEKFETDVVKANINSFIKDNKSLEIITTFNPKNLGLKKNIIQGLNKVFKLEDAAIILEDDCLPTPDFFKFTKAMLTKYKDEPKVMSINGTSTGGRFSHSYDFSRYPQCWGWATWKRAWNLYDSTLTTFTPESWRALAAKLGFNPLLSWYWRTMLTMVKAGWINTWDFQWSYAHFYHEGLSIAPSVNLIKNIGFDLVATNTKTKSKVADMKTNTLSWPLTHPINIDENKSISHRAVYDFYLNPVAIAGLLRQYVYWTWSKYGHWS